MKELKLNAIVSGFDCEGEAFTNTVEFELLPPQDSNHYGTGYYMIAKTPYNRHLIDVRYERTTDIKELAKRWISGHYGKNAQQVIYCTKEG